MAHTLPAVIQHVTAQNRPGSHGAILVREIERLRAELDEAVAMVNEMDEADVSRLKSIEADIDAWHEGELAAGRDVPDFWGECRTSEGLASHLTALGYARTAAPPTTDT